MCHHNRTVTLFFTVNCLTALYFIKAHRCFTRNQFFTTLIMPLYKFKTSKIMENHTCKNFITRTYQLHRSILNLWIRPEYYSGTTFYKSNVLQTMRIVGPQWANRNRKPRLNLTLASSLSVWAAVRQWHLPTKCCFSLDKNLLRIFSWCSWNLKSLGKPWTKKPRTQTNKRTALQRQYQQTLT